MGKIIAIANQKEALENYYISKSAASLGVLEKKVLLIDADPQANASSGLDRCRNQSKLEPIKFRAQQRPKDAIVKCSATVWMLSLLILT
jgi:chromosome partitioning protein